MKELIVTVGLPRSGKSTWAREQGFPIVNKDSIRLALHGKRFLKDAEPWVHAIAKTMVKSLFFAGHDKVIVDECNVMKKHREEWISDEWNTIFYLISTTKERCILRAKAEYDSEIIPIIEKMSNQFEDLEDVSYSEI